MQINLFSAWSKEFLKYLGWILLFAFLWFKGCAGASPSPQIAKVIVPEVKGVFESKKPIHEAIVKPSSRSQEKGKKVFIENPIDQKLIIENEKLKSDYAKASDSIKQLSFNRAIQLNKFTSNFENDDIKIDITGVVQGEVKEITPSYKIKERKVDVPIKETVFRLLAGGAVGVNKELNQAAYRLDLNFQNRKGDIISAEYLKIGTQSFGMVGFKKSILNIKR